MQIGIIGLGDMGKLYARNFAKAGYQVCGSDLPQNFEDSVVQMSPHGVEVLFDGHEVARRADFLLFCVEAEKIDEVVFSLAKSVKYQAIIGGQTSVKHPEIKAFESHLPPDINIISCHSLHGPAIDTAGQSLIVIRHRTTEEAYQRAIAIFQALKSIIIEMDDYHEHDKIMANTQAITHMGFESMGSAWKNAGFFPWDNPAYAEGIDNVKILTTLRIFAYKAHIYAGLAILNPYARAQVKVYAKAESELFKLMICEDELQFRDKLIKARDYVFAKGSPPLLTDELLSSLKLNEQQHVQKPNSHLSILSMVYAWYKMKINPYDNLICQTPPFKLRLGIAEYLFRNNDMLEQAIQTALFDKSIRADDLEFHTAVHEWASIIGYGDIEGYKQHFEAAKSFFGSRLEVALKLSSAMINKL